MTQGSNPGLRGGQNLYWSELQGRSVSKAPSKDQKAVGGPTPGNHPFPKIVGIILVLINL